MAMHHWASGSNLSMMAQVRAVDPVDETFANNETGFSGLWFAASRRYRRKKLPSPRKPTEAQPEM